MIIKVEPDKQKAESLKKIAKVTLDRLRETDREKYSSNTLTDYYKEVNGDFELFRRD